MTQQKKAVEIFEAPYRYVADYLYSYGEISKFFREVKDNKQLHGTKCPQCGMVWCPPRGFCSHCYVATDWVPLTGKGTVIACTYCYFEATGEEQLPHHFDLPFIMAIIKLDGADTGFLHTVRSKEAKMGEVKAGTRVKIVWREPRLGKVVDFYFVPDDGK